MSHSVALGQRRQAPANTLPSESLAIYQLPMDITDTDDYDDVVHSAHAACPRGGSMAAALVAGRARRRRRRSASAACGQWLSADDHCQSLGQPP